MITKAVILGMLADGQMHGYEIKKRIRTELGDAADINFGSIYYGLRSFVAKGWVDHIRDEPGEGSPDRSIYRITAKGRKHLRRLLEQILSNTDAPLQPVEVGLNFMSHLPSVQVREILSERYNCLKARYDEALAGEQGADSAPAARFIREHRLYLLGAEVLWLKNLIPALEKIKSGAGRR